MAILLADYYSGKTHIIVELDRERTPEEKQAIIDKISRDASIALRAEAVRVHRDKTA